jgi:hypothetical protein
MPNPKPAPNIIPYLRIKLDLNKINVTKKPAAAPFTVLVES